MNFAIVGCGTIGISTAGCFEKLTSERLTAVYDRTYERAKALGDKYGVKIYTDYEKLLGDPEVEGVIICTASHVHGEQVLRAIEAGRAVACEKPLEVEMGKVFEIIETSNRTGVKVQCLLQRRCYPIVQAVKAAVERGYLGKICLAEGRFKYYRDQHYYDEAPWRGVSGGVLLNQGIHGIDMLLWMLGEKVKKVYASTGTLAHETAAEDAACAVLTLENGGVVTINATTDAFEENMTGFAIHGTLGSVCFDLDGGKVKWSFKDPESAPAGPEEMEEYIKASAVEREPYMGDMHAFLINDLNEAVRENRQPMISAYECVESLKVILAMLESGKTGMAVDLE